MPGENDEDYDGVDPGGKGGKLRWNRFKWILFGTNTIVRRFPLRFTREMASEVSRFDGPFRRPLPPVHVAMAQWTDRFFSLHS